MVKHAESDVTCATSNIENVPGFRGLIREGSCTRVQGAHKGVFPQAVDAEGHEVVHGVVRAGDGGEDVFDSGLFGGFGDGFEAEVGGADILGGGLLWALG